MRLFIILLACLWALPAWADEAREQRVREIAHQLRCPTCQAMSVKESEAGLANNMKAKIQEMLEQGKSEEEILKFFVDRYGEWILRNPPKQGVNLVLWLAPFGLVLVAGLGVLLYLKRNAKGAAPTGLKPLSAQEKAEIEKDLNQIT